MIFEAVINTGMFKSHSTRAASASAAKRDNIPVDHTLKLTGNWTNVQTFHKYYDKVVLPYTV